MIKTPVFQRVRQLDLLAQRLRFPGAALLAVLVCSSGCIAVPIPTPEHTPMDTVTRQNIDAETVDWIQPGRTRLAEVLLKLGEPDQVSADSQKLAYRWQKVSAYVLVGVPGGGGVGPWLKDYYLVIECDADGVIRDRRLSHRLLHKASPPELFENGNANAGWVADAENKIAGPAEWFPGVEGFAWLRKSWWTIGDPPKGRRGKLTLTTNELCFQEPGQFLNEPPALTLPFKELSECRLAKYGFGRRLVVRARTGEVHSFTFWGVHGIMEDKKVTGLAYDFIQSRIRQSSEVGGK